MENPIDFTGKRVLVTGASRGIGRAVAAAFAGQGARVAVHYNRDRSAADAVLAGLPGGPHTMVQGDLSDPDAARPVVEVTLQDLGGLDILVNNAGIHERRPVQEGSFEDWHRSFQRTLSVNLSGPAHLIFWAVRHMIDAGGGRIVNVSSRGAFRGEPDAPAYGASKAGLNALSQSLAKALAPHGIYVSVVAPGFVETEMAEPLLNGPEGDAIRGQSPMGRVARPEEVADTVLFLASTRTRFLTGAIVDVNGASYLRS